MSGAWDLPDAHVVRVAAQPADVDVYGHVNNAVYLRWLDEAAWSHSSALGVRPEDCVQWRCGMVVRQSRLHYLAPCHSGDALEVGTWLVAGDGRLRVDRRFQIRRPGDGRTLLRAELEYVCVDLDSGRPRRMPPVFVESYRPR